MHVWTDSWPIFTNILYQANKAEQLEFALYRNAQTGKGTLVECEDFSLR